MTRRQFYNLLWRVLSERKGVEIKVHQEGIYYNLKMHWGDKSEYITDVEYTLNEYVAQMKKIKFERMIEGT